MPKSKRDKVVSLTATKKKAYDTKKDLVAEVQECCNKFKSIYLIEVHNERNNLLKEIRNDWKSSRLFMGRNKVMAVGLGRTKESEHKPNLHKVANMLIGKRGLLFTNENTDVVSGWFGKNRRFCFARSGSVATETVELPSGPLDLPHSMEPQLRQLGLPTKLKDGIVILEHDHTVCTAGKALTTQQAVILKHLGNCMAQFQVDIIAHWSDEQFTLISSDSIAMDTNLESLDGND